MPSTYVDQADELWSILNRRDTDTIDLKDLLEEMLNALWGKIDAAVTALTAEGISITTAEVTYIAPTETAPTVPAIGQVAMTDAVLDAMFVRGQENQDRIKASNLDIAANRAALWGHDEWDETETVLTDNANDAGDEETSKNAVENVIEQARMQRDDTFNLLANDIAVWQGEWKNQIDSERARLAFADLELKRDIEPERIRGEFDLKATELAEIKNVQWSLDTIQVYAQLLQSLLSASPVGARSALGISLSGDA